MKVAEISPRGGYVLYLRFEGGAAGEVDLSDFAGKGVFASWLEPGVFNQVRVAEEGHVEWPGNIDLCPDMLYMRLTGKRPEEIFPKLRNIPAHA